MSDSNFEKLQAGLRIARATQDEFKSDLAQLTVPQLREMVRKVRSTRGMSVRQHYVDALLSWHTGECLKAAGYIPE
jgi:hypothetical protein